MTRNPTALGAQLALLTVCALVVPAQLYLAIPLAPHIQGSFHTSHTAASWTGSAFALAYAVGFLIFGPLSDRYGRRQMLVGGMVGLAAATAGICLSPDLVLFFFFRAAQGLAAATFAPVALVWVAEKASGERRGAALAVLTTGLLGAGLAGQLYGTATLDVMPWRWMFVTASIPYLVLAVLLHTVLEAGGERKSASLGTVYRPVARLATQRSTASVFLAALAVFGSFVGMYAALDDHLTSTEYVTSAGLLAVEGIGCLGLLAAPTLHWLARAPVSPRTQTLLGFSVAATGILVEQIDTTWLVPVAASVGYVAGISLVVPGLVGLLARHAPDDRAAAVGVNTFMLFVGAAIAPLVVDHFSYRSSLAMLAAALLAAAGVIAAGVPRSAPAVVLTTAGPAATVGRAGR
jgi:YNFM family putative membrane transporter